MQLSRMPIGPVFLKVSDNHGGARQGKKPGNSSANARRRPGDELHLTVELEPIRRRHLPFSLRSVALLTNDTDALEGVKPVAPRFG